MTDEARPPNFRNATALLAGALLLAVPYLALCGMPLRDIVFSLAYSATLALLGAGSMGSLARRFPDRLSLLLAGWIVSTIALALLGFVFLHRAILPPSSGSGTANSLLAANAAWLVLAAALWRFRATKDWPERWSVLTRRRTSTLFLTALTMATLTYAGKLNVSLHERSPHTNLDLPEWASHSDFRIHMIRNVVPLHTHGYPPRKLAHRGVQIVTLSDARLTGDAELTRENVVKRARGYALPLYFAVIYFTQIISTRHYRLRAGASALAVASTLLFGTISLAPLSTNYSTYLLGLAGGTMFYHNVTHLWSYAVALPGVMLILSSLRGRLDASFVLGVFFVCGSFFFKPSTFSVLAPSLVVVSFLSRASERRFVAYGLALLLAVPIFWWIYPELFGTAKTRVDLVVAPLRKFLFTTKHQLPPFVTQHGALWIFTILITSLAAFLPALVTMRPSWADFAPSGLLERLRARRSEWLILGVLLTGVSPVLLLKPPLGANSNLGWGASAAILLAIPLLLATVVERRPSWARRLTFALLLLHCWGGLQHLLHFVPSGRLVGAEW